MTVNEFISYSGELYISELPNGMYLIEDWQRDEGQIIIAKDFNDIIPALDKSLEFQYALEGYNLYRDCDKVFESYEDLLSWGEKHHPDSEKTEYVRTIVDNGPLENDIELWNGALTEENIRNLTENGFAVGFLPGYWDGAKGIDSIIKDEKGIVKITANRNFDYALETAGFRDTNASHYEIFAIFADDSHVNGFAVSNDDEKKFIALNNIQSDDFIMELGLDKESNFARELENLEIFDGGIER